MRKFPFVLLFACHHPVETDSGPADTDDTVETDTTDTDVFAGPACTSGSTFVSWTRDGGVTVAPVTQGPSINTYTWSIAIADDAPDVLIAEHGGTLWRSTDAGCTFTSLGTITSTLWDLHAIGGGEVWGHVENGTDVLHLSGDVIEESAGPVETSLLGMTVDHGRVIVGTSSATLYERSNNNWNSLGGPPNGGNAYDWAFDPKDADRAVVGLMSDGLWWTHDGTTWHAATGISTPTNIFSVAWSPVDADVVWAEGLDIDEMDAGAPSQGRHIWRSTDGGQSFTAVVANSAEVTLTNGLPMTPDPVDAGVVWFEFGTSFQGEGTWVYRYDHGTGAVTRAHQPTWDEFRALVFSPADPTLMYVALVNEQIN